MAEIASLGIEIDARPVDAGAKALDSLAASGEKAGVSIDNLTRRMIEQNRRTDESARANAKWTAELKRQSTAHDGLATNTTDATAALKHQEKAIKLVSTAARTVTTAVLVMASAFAYKVVSAIKATAALENLAATTSVTVETLSSLQQTARIGGHSLEAISTMASRFARSVAEATGGNKEMIRSFEALGISQERLRSGKFDDLYVEFATKIGGAENKTYAIAHATDIAGQSAAQAMPFFKDLAETGMMNATVTTQQAAAADELQKQFGRLGNAFDNIVKKIANDVVPVMSEWLEKATSAFTATGNLATALSGLANLGQFGDTAVEQIANIDKALEKVKKQQGFFTGWLANPLLGMRESGLLNARAVVVAQLKARGFGESTGDTGVPNPSGFALGAPTPATPKGRTDTSGPSMIAALREQLAALNGENTEVDKTIRKLTEGTKVYSLVVRATALAIAGEIDEKRLLNKSIENTAKNETALTKKREEGAAAMAASELARGEALISGYKAVEQIEFETSLIGKSNDERRLAIALRGIELSIITREGDAREQLAAKTTAALEKSREASRSFEAGVKEGFNTYLDTATNAAVMSKNLIVNAFQGMEDALVKFVQTGKLDFKSFANSIIEDMIRIQIRQSITGPLASAGQGIIGSFVSSLFGGGGSGLSLAGGSATAAGGIGLSTTGGIGLRFANGGDFTVGGGGGTDSQTVSFRATPGEKVSVRTPAQAAQATSGGTYYIDARGADSEAVTRLEGVIRTLNGSIERRAVAAVADTRMRGGALSGAMR